MPRCSIVFHSATGNNHIIAAHLGELLRERGLDVRIYRVEDSDLHIFANRLETANEYLEEILALPVIANDKLQKSQMVVLGSPTYFADMSAEMKTFLDGTIDLYASKALRGKGFACFATCGESRDDARHALAAMRRWAAQNEMTVVPTADLIHVSGEEGRIRPSIEFGKELEDFADAIAGALGPQEE